MYLDIFKVDNYDCLNLPNLDATNSELLQFGEDGVKPTNHAILNIPNSVNKVTVKLKDEYADIPIDIVILDEHGEYLHEQLEVSMNDGLMEINGSLSNQFHIGIGIFDGEFIMYWLEVNIGDYVPGEPKSNAHEHLGEFVIDGELDIVTELGDDTQTVIDFVNGRITYPISGANYTLSEVANGFMFSKHDAFRDEYFLTYINTYDFYDEENGGRLTRETYVSTADSNVFSISNDIEIPYDIGLLESYIVVISSVHFDEFIDNPSLVNTEFLVAFGTRFVVNGSNDGGDYDMGDGSKPVGNIGGGGTWGDSDEEGETWEEGQQFDPDATQSITVLEGNSLRQYSVVPDIYNVRISKQINGHHTLTFNLQPYTNASNIYTPRVLEIDGEYYDVQQIKKRRQINNLEMDIYCEHVSYQLNQAPSEFFDDVAGTFVWTEDTYSDYARGILSEMLSFHDNFFIARVDSQFNREYTFKTSTEGFRSRIHEFAAFIGAEVEWKKFSVSLVRPNVGGIGLTLEVGKNIIAMTEIIDSTRNGRTTRSYEVDLVDLHHITDQLEKPLELIDIRLGDIVTLIDKQYGINRTDRIVAIEYDPFNKALPIIELENGVKSFTNSDDSQKLGVPKMSVDYVIETARADFSYGMYFQFTRPYTRVFSVTLSLAYNVPPMRIMSETVSTTSVENEYVNVPPSVVYHLHWDSRSQSYKGVTVYTEGSGEVGWGVEVSMQAICDPLGEVYEVIN